MPILGFSCPLSKQDPLQQNILDWPSKIGGVPIWLNPLNPLTVSNTYCCSNVMILLLQYYELSNVHSVYYIYTCTKCHSFKVFRFHLPLNSTLYSDQGFPINSSTTCRVCNLGTSKSCSRCKSAFYCSIQHQKLDYYLIHKKTCSISNKIYNHSIFFTESELVFELEPDSIKNDKIQEIIDKTEILEMQSSDDPEHDVNVDDTQVQVDDIFLQFQERLERDPTQVLRCYDLHEEGLFVNASLNFDNVAKCELCLKDRRLILQVMPQILNYIKSDLDFASLYVFTCDCEIKDFVQEVILKHNFSDQGLKGPIAGQ